MAYAVKYQHELYGSTLKPGDVLVSNHPIAGGTHLPDITVITPVFDTATNDLIFYTASRGHHRDIGGFQGISGNANATELYQEGASIVSFKLVSDGHFDEEGIRKILVDEPAQHPNCVGTSSLYDNLSDLRAQVAANAKGSALIQGLFEEYGREVVQVNINILIHSKDETNQYLVLHGPHTRERRDRSAEILEKDFREAQRPRFERDRQSRQRNPDQTRDSY